jgi:hypothetical protein
MLLFSNVCSISKISKRPGKINETFNTPKKFKPVHEKISRIQSRTTLEKSKRLKTFQSIHHKTKSASIQKIKYERPRKTSKVNQILTPGTQDSEFCIEEDGIEVSFSSEESLDTLRRQVKSALEFEKPAKKDSESFLNFNKDLSIEEKRKTKKKFRLVDFAFIKSVLLLGFPNIK